MTIGRPVGSLRTSGLQLDNDEKLIRLIAETVHPEVLVNAFDVGAVVE